MAGKEFEGQQDFESSWTNLDDASTTLPGLSIYGDDDFDEHQAMTEVFDRIQSFIMADAEKSNKVEKKLALHHGGYQQRARMLRQKIVEASEALEKECTSLDSFRTLQIAEEAALPRRLEALREEVAIIQKREREAQESYRIRAEELASLSNGLVNGGP
ncbi:MAG: hypothetical protein Q9214_007698 [Letrouitia sp. 1 TL-2023]